MNLFLMVGNIGMGKSTLTKKIAKENNAVCVNNDSLIQMIGGGDYTLYDEKKKDIYTIIEKMIVVEGLSKGFDVVIDRTLISLEKRKKWIDLGKRYMSNIVCFDFGWGTEEGLQRRIKENKGHSEEVWKSVYEKLKKEYEKPDISEGLNEIIIINNRGD